MGIEALLSTQIIDTTAVGRAVMTAADAAAARTAIGAGTSSFSGAYSALSGIPSTFAPSAHKTSHATGGSDALTAADIGAAATSHTHAASDITSGIIATARLATGTASASTYLRGDQTWASVSAGVGGSTGSVDNGVLRADGTGGSTVQSSDWIIADNYTASPNNTVNHASIQATGGTTNVSVSIVPKGTGAFSLHVPDGTATGGNARGANAIDFQTVRNAATQVAAGDQSFLGAGWRNSATNTQAAAVGGNQSHATGIGAFVAGSEVATASGQNSAVLAGRSTNATAQYALATGFGADARLYASQAHSSNPLNLGAGLNQAFRVTLGRKTTDATATVLFLDRDQSFRLTLQANTIQFADVLVVGIKSDGTAVAAYKRKVVIKRVVNTTSIVNVETIGTDYEDNASTDIAITADDTNDAWQIAVTGISGETWRWFATVSGIELQYGT